MSSHYGMHTSSGYNGYDDDHDSVRDYGYGGNSCYSPRRPNYPPSNRTVSVSTQTNPHEFVLDDSEQNTNCMAIGVMILGGMMFLLPFW